MKEKRKLINPNNKMVADEIRNARELAGLNQTELAEKVGVRQQMISAIERGVMPCPDELMWKLKGVIRLNPKYVCFFDAWINLPANDYDNTLPLFATKKEAIFFTNGDSYVRTIHVLVKEIK